MRQRHQASSWRAELLGHAPVGADAKGALTMRRAEVVLAAPAWFALHASVDGLYDDSSTVLADTSELVAQDLAASEADVAEVGPTDAGRPHVEQGAGTGRFVELDDRHSSLGATDGLHDPSLRPTPRPERS